MRPVPPRSAAEIQTEPVANPGPPDPCLPSPERLRVPHARGRLRSGRACPDKGRMLKEKFEIIKTCSN
eukprot:8290806-Pyramimonas_sp.AAC.1